MIIATIIIMMTIMIIMILIIVTMIMIMIIIIIIMIIMTIMTIMTTARRETAMARGPAAEGCPSGWRPMVRHYNMIQICMI